MAQLHHLSVTFQILEDCYVSAKETAGAIAKCRRQFKACLEVSTVFTSTGPLCRLKLVITLSQHGVAAAALHFSRKQEEQGNAFNEFQHV